MCLLRYLFEQLWWASASELIARIEDSKRRGDRQKQMHLIFGGRRGTNQNSDSAPFWENSDVNSKGRIDLWRSI